jgi:hypothetical protein
MTEDGAVAQEAQSRRPTTVTSMAIAASGALCVPEVHWSSVGPAWRPAMSGVGR